jgi:hypothetical protein
MKGNTLNQFMDDLYSMGGPEKEFLYNGKKYFLQCEAVPNSNMIEMVIFECFGEEKYIFRCKGECFGDCVEQFEVAKIFDGKTIYEAEKDIEVLFG